MDDSYSSMNRTETAVFGSGCFWCTEAIFKMLKGVISVTPGYSGGNVPNPTDNDIYSGKSGHAEVVRIVFMPSMIPFSDLLEIFFHLHDPTSLNRQGYDVGTHYRSVIFYLDETQHRIAQETIERLNKSGEFKSKIVTELAPFEAFYEAAKYHQNFYENNSSMPYCQLIIDPKLQKLREKYSNKLKAT